MVRSPSGRNGGTSFRVSVHQSANRQSPAWLDAVALLAVFVAVTFWAWA